MSPAQERATEPTSIPRTGPGTPEALAVPARRRPAGYAVREATPRCQGSACCASRSLPGPRQPRGGRGAPSPGGKACTHVSLPGSARVSPRPGQKRWLSSPGARSHPLRPGPGQEEGLGPHLPCWPGEGRLRCAGSRASATSRSQRSGHGPGRLGKSPAHAKTTAAPPGPRGDPLERARPPGPPHRGPPEQFI